MTHGGVVGLPDTELAAETVVTASVTDVRGTDLLEATTGARSSVPAMQRWDHQVCRIGCACVLT